MTDKIKTPDPFKTIEIDGNTYKTYGIFREGDIHAVKLYQELLTIHDRVIWQKENGWTIIYTPKYH